MVTQHPRRRACGCLGFRHDVVMPNHELRTRRRGSAPRALGWVLVVCVLVVSLTTVAVLASSLVVDGSSMEPTLHNGDRVLVDPRSGIDDLDRFDVVHAQIGPGRVSVAKRVIGLPGDQVVVRPGSGDRGPVVWVRPKGEGAWQEVTDSAWQEDATTRACCSDDGTISGRPRAATVPDGRVFLVGDNLGHSDDSRVFGWVPADRVTGVFVLRLRPFADVGPLPGRPRLDPAHESPPGQGSAS